MENIDPILSDDEVQRLAEMIIELHPDKLNHQSVVEIALALFEDIAGLELLDDQVSATLADNIWRVIASTTQINSERKEADGNCKEKR